MSRFHADRPTAESLATVRYTTHEAGTRQSFRSDHLSRRPELEDQNTMSSAVDSAEWRSAASKYWCSVETEWGQAVFRFANRLTPLTLLAQSLQSIMGGTDIFRL